MSKFALFCPVTKMYFCDEPYMEIKGKAVPPVGVAVKRKRDATHYRSEASAAEARRLKAPEFPEIVPA